jgi:hypothetical protein
MTDREHRSTTGRRGNISESGRRLLREEVGKHVICSARIELRHWKASKCQPGLEPKPHVDLALNDERLAKH